MPPRRTTPVSQNTINTNNPEFCNELFARLLERPRGQERRIRNPTTGYLIDPHSGTFSGFFDSCIGRSGVNQDLKSMATEETLNRKAWSDYAIHTFTYTYDSRATNTDIEFRNRVLRRYRRDHPYAGPSRTTYDLGESPPAAAPAQRRSSSSSSDQTQSTPSSNEEIQNIANDSLVARITEQLFNGVFSNIQELHNAPGFNRLPQHVRFNLEEILINDLPDSDGSNVSSDTPPPPAAPHPAAPPPAPPVAPVPPAADLTQQQRLCHQFWVNALTSTNGTMRNPFTGSTIRNIGGQAFMNYVYNNRCLMTVPENMRLILNGMISPGGPRSVTQIAVNPYQIAHPELYPGTYPTNRYNPLGPAGLEIVRNFIANPNLMIR